MARKGHKAEEIVAKLRQVDVLVSQGQSVADAIRSIGDAWRLKPESNRTYSATDRAAPRSSGQFVCWHQRGRTNANGGPEGPRRS